RRLQEAGFVETARQKPVELTPKGKRLALFAKERHRILVDFFISLGVPPKVAETDAEGAEHHISETTLERINQFMRQQRD
ncbi:MAG: transcriptional regulator MntR, partial [Proteobacteria bacterium]